VHSKDVIDFLKHYLTKEKVDIIVVGEPKTLSNVQSDSARFIDPFVKHLQRTFPQVKVERYDERFTSSIAQQTMLLGGMKKKDRKIKENVDKISATIILQDYMEFIKYKKD
jgi:putative Holliday junction resolvase